MLEQRYLQILTIKTQVLKLSEVLFLNIPNGSQTHITNMHWSWREIVYLLLLVSKPNVLDIYYSLP